MPKQYYQNSVLYTNKKNNNRKQICFHESIKYRLDYNSLIFLFTALLATKVDQETKTHPL